jgi:hypothetical protein
VGENSTRPQPGEVGEQACKRPRWRGRFGAGNWESRGGWGRRYGAGKSGRGRPTPDRSVTRATWRSGVGLKSRKSVSRVPASRSRQIKRLSVRKGAASKLCTQSLRRKGLAGRGVIKQVIRILAVQSVLGRRPYTVPPWAPTPDCETSHASATAEAPRLA